MRISQWPETERPRQKLIERGADALSDAELLAILLGTGVAGRTAVDLGRALIARFGNLRSLLNAECHCLCREHGVGTAKFVQLRAALELGRRYLAEALLRGDSLNSPAQASAFLQATLRDRSSEYFCLLYLDAQHRVLGFQELFRGTVNGAAVHPREVVKAALERNAVAVIVAHNHPSGVAEPSPADAALTARLKQALGLMDIRLLDHLIIGDGEVISLSERGLL